MPSNALPYTRSEVKDRARTWAGATNVTLPSFTSDFKGLNRAGIEHDIRHGAKLGFWGTLVASECGTTVDEYVEFMQIAADAAPDDFALVAHFSFDTTEEVMRVADVAESLGFEAALLSYLPDFRPKNAAEIVEWTKFVADGTDLALILFAVPTWGFKPLDPTGFPPEAIVEMANLETAAALKYECGGSATMTAFADIHRRCGDQVIVENPKEQFAPAIMSAYPDVRWIGTSAYESFGDRVPKVMKLVSEDRWDEAMDVFWSYNAAREAKGAFHGTFGGANLIHRNGWKYLSWMHGFNGGLLRMPQMRLIPGQMKGLRAGLEASGFDVPATDEGFVAGRNPA